MPRLACLRTSLILLLGALCAGWPGAGRAAELTPTEQRWLRGVWPVVAQAREQKLPLDIVVQPQPTPGAAPLALAFVGGRCKLVFSMRGNDAAQATLDRIAPDLLDAALGLMAAHEVHGHCRRHLDGTWFTAPPGVTTSVPPQLREELHAAYLTMRATRREEGFADLAGLAWARRHHPALYPRLHAWLVAEREHELIEGSHHDTLAWLRQAAQADGEAALSAAPPALAALWRAVLEQER